MIKFDSYQRPTPSRCFDTGKPEDAASQVEQCLGQQDYQCTTGRICMPLNFANWELA